MAWLKNTWGKFEERHPELSKWIREGGLFVIVSNLITVFKYLLLTFLPLAFASLGTKSFGWPGIEITLFGKTFPWNIFGYGEESGGTAYFAAYMIAMIIGEAINFPVQKYFVFRNREKPYKQIAWYVLAFCVITLICNSVICIWNAVADLLVPAAVYNIGTVFINGGISMIVFFFVNKIIFPESAKKNKEDSKNFNS